MDTFLFAIRNWRDEEVINLAGTEERDFSKRLIVVHLPCHLNVRYALFIIDLLNNLPGIIFDPRKLKQLGAKGKRRGPESLVPAKILFLRVHWCPVGFVGENNP